MTQFVALPHVKRREASRLPAWPAIAVLSTTLVVGCNCPKPPSDASTLSAPTRAAVESATTAFHHALRTNDTATFLSYIAEDVVMMPPGEPPVQGKDAMRAWYAGFLTQYRTSSLTLDDREVFVGAGWATELGTYQWGLTPAGGGAPVLDRGHYMQVWRQQPDGQWRFAREIWNSSAPPSPPGGK
jgi:uncharacterized protein (TIGR02246 family)